MNYGACILSVVPVRKEPAHQAEMVNQLLFGDHYEVLESEREWYHIRTLHDGYSGWINELQHTESGPFDKDRERVSAHFTGVLSAIALETRHPNEPIRLPFGAFLPSCSDGACHVAGNTYQVRGEIFPMPGIPRKETILDQAYKLLGIPYLWGGRSHYGIDCSGFTQTIFRMSGIALPRDASDQQKTGVAVETVEEVSPADLAFFHNEKGSISHVGILLDPHLIIHASGKVRVDYFDQKGIFRKDLGVYSHPLHSIRKVL